MSSRNERDSIHFALRLKALYTRLTFNPWRKYVVYLGHAKNRPYNSKEKCFIHILNDNDDFVEKNYFCCFTDHGLLPFADHSIDMIVCDLSLIPRSLVSVFFTEAERVLNTQGKMVITVNNTYSPYYFGRSAESTYSSWKIRRLLKDHQLIILKSFYQSFIWRHSPRCLRSWLIRWESLFKRFFYVFANKITFLVVKETDFYQPLPAYLRLSKKLVPSEPVPVMISARDES